MPSDVTLLPAAREKSLEAGIYQATRARGGRRTKRTPERTGAATVRRQKTRDLDTRDVLDCILKSSRSSAWSVGEHHVIPNSQTMRGQNKD
jgi:hypothetical protein